MLLGYTHVFGVGQHDYTIIIIIIIIIIALGSKDPEG